MQTMVQANQISNVLLWVGRVMSGLVIAFMLFDGVMKLIPLDVVISTSEQMGIPIPSGSSVLSARYFTRSRARQCSAQSC
jgi:hypothetical protein